MAGSRHITHTPSVDKSRRVSTESPRRSRIGGGSVQLSVQDDVLLGSKVKHFDGWTPNSGGAIFPRYLVFHYTAGRDTKSAVNWLTNPAAKASAHLVVGRDGAITQLAPFTLRTWHAGLSHWDGLSGLNSYAVGIEMDNAGSLTKVGDRYQAWFGLFYGESQCAFLQHKHEEVSCWWHAYTEAQIEVTLALASLLVRHYNLQDILGHDDISPGRKRDPGPAFPLDHIRAKVLGRAEESEERYVVTATALNIRSGPDVKFHPVASALPHGTQVCLLEKRDRWSKVEASGGPDVEGWVHNKFLERL